MIDSWNSLFPESLMPSLFGIPLPIGVSSETEDVRFIFSSTRTFNFIRASMMRYILPTDSIMVDFI